MHKSMNAPARLEVRDLSGDRLSRQFLRWLWRRHRMGFVFLAARRAGSDQMTQRAFNLARGGRDIEKFLKDRSAEDYHLYYCPNAFSQVSRRTEYALPTPFAHCDIDEGDPTAFCPLPTIVIETSPGRYQGIWLFGQPADPSRAEATSKWLVYTYGGDRNGWSITKFLRIPGSINHKPQYNRPRVRIVGDIGEPIEAWPEIPLISRRRLSHEIEVDPLAHNWREVIRRYRSKLAWKYLFRMEDNRVVSPDRSRIIFMIVAELDHAGASPDEIASVVWRSPYFVDKHGQSRRRLNEELSRILSKIRRRK
jgi:hypothetical protein